MDGQTTVTVAINATADGNNTIIAALPGQKIRVLAFVLTNATTAGTVRFDDSAATVLARFNFGLAGGVSFTGADDRPAFEVGSGLGLVLVNGAGVDTLGFITYSVH